MPGDFRVLPEKEHAGLVAGQPIGGVELFAFSAHFGEKVRQSGNLPTGPPESIDPRRFEHRQQQFILKERGDKRLYE
jgi:hypothetical protein